VFVVDGNGAIISANKAAESITGQLEYDLCKQTLGELFGDMALHNTLLEKRFSVPQCEAGIGATRFLVQAHPVKMEPAGDGRVVAGGVLTLRTLGPLPVHRRAIPELDQAGFAVILGECGPMVSLKSRTARLAGLDAPLLILGETGTGKELVARACHAASKRSVAPFLALNCAALPESLAESELFGYASGAFSGAHRGGKPGLLELANHGTVFLDEIGEMSPYLQAKLLRFLNDGTFWRVGGDREMRVDVRIISATHRDLEQMVLEKVFREDLFYRLNVLNLRLPALRDRSGDISLLAQYFVDQACLKIERSGCRLTPAAHLALRGNPWPGNVRQLQNVIFRAVAMSDKPMLDVDDLELGSARAQERAEPSAEGPDSLDEAVATFEKNLLEDLYARYPSSRQLAVRLKTSHTTVANKLRKYGISRREFV
jgi:transcriptional regulator of aroF, aroG, tyrA and aromatic amino acid transport